MGTTYGTVNYEPSWADILMQLKYLPWGCAVKVSTRYLARTGILDCPATSKEKSGKSFLSEDPTKLASYTNVYPAYLYNACKDSEKPDEEKFWGPGKGNNSGMKTVRVRYPSSTMLFSDGSYISIDSNNDSLNRFSKRHSNTLNIVHCDGSVKNYKYVVKTFYLLYSGINRR